MIGNQNRWQEDLFVAGPLSGLIPDDHILRRVDKILDLSWLRKELAGLYSETHGRPSIDPEAAVRLMLAGFFQGIVHDRKLMREAQVNLAIRWFAGYRLDERLPDHSSLTRIRQRWGPQRFKLIFQRTVQACMQAGLVDGETVHIDATLIRADVSWKSLTTEHADKVLKENTVEDNDNDPPKELGRPSTKRPKAKKFSRTDPDATMSTSCNQYRMEPCYKQHTAVDDSSGVVVDVETTTGEVSEGKELLNQVKRIENNTGKKVKTLTADAGYAHGRNYEALERRDTDAIIPPQAEQKSPKRIPARRFKYDSENKIVHCPTGKILHRSCRNKQGWVYRARARDCCSCRLRKRCISPTAKVRIIVIGDGYESLLRARRRRQRWDEKTVDTYKRHRWRVEAVHGEAKTQHGLRRAVRRGLANVAIQVYLTAAVMNLKRLAAFAGDFYREIIDYLLDILAVTKIKFSIRGFLGNSGTKYLKSC